MVRVLTLSTLFPDASRPRFGCFVECQTLELAAREGVEVQVVAPLGLPPMGRAFGQYRDRAALPLCENWKGLTVHRPRFTHLPKTGGRFDPPAMTRALLPLLQSIRREFAFDVIDTQFFFPDGPAAVALGRALDVPVSIKARGSDIHLWGNGPRRGDVVAAGQKADGMLAVSAALKADMASLGIPADKIRVHYTGLDHDRFFVRDRAEAKAKLGVAGPLLVGVGALIERKGHRLVVEAMKQLPGVTLALIGQGEDRPTLEAMARDGGIADRVLFPGSLPGDAVADWLAAADAMVLMSVSEGLANAWVEALASGTPLVIADVGGARELVENRGSGVLAARDPTAIAAAVFVILDAKPDRQQTARAVKHFSWAENAAQLEGHLQGLVDQYADRQSSLSGA